VTKTSLLVMIGVLLACATGPQIAPKAPRPPVGEEELAKLDGAKSVKRFEFNEGIQVHTGEIHGHQLTHTMYVGYGPAPGETTHSYGISGGTVYIPRGERVRGRVVCEQHPQSGGPIISA
jgi:hypothetical protein